MELVLFREEPLLCYSHCPSNSVFNPLSSFRKNTPTILPVRFEQVLKLSPLEQLILTTAPEQHLRPKEIPCIGSYQFLH